MVIISNGFNKFHLSSAAAEMDRIKRLSLLLTGAYPLGLIRKASKLPLMQNNRKFRRLLARKDKVEDKRVRSFWLPEMIHETASLLKRAGAAIISEKLDVFSFYTYGCMAAKLIENDCERAQLYHYRAGFGGRSVMKAKASGMLTLCDHSIAHPCLCSYLINHNGRMPVEGAAGDLSEFERWLLADIEKADVVLVNSGFVKDTFLHQGWPSNRVHTIYWGVDDQFMTYAQKQNRSKKSKAGPLRFLFAGVFGRRKGADNLIAAVSRICKSEWALQLAGHIDSEIEKRYPDFFENPHVKFSGLLPRSELASLMKESDVFVFPSLVEGSARVIFEALACGCYIITTANSGSIVENGVQGGLVAPDDPKALAEAMQWAIDNREIVREVGINNMQLIESRYRQRHYGMKLSRLYNQLLGCEQRYGK